MKPINLITFKDPKSPASEVYRTLRTNLKFASFEKEIRTIVFTSSGPNEGKSTIVVNLGVCLAQEGKNVLILEGDLRNPTVHKCFSLPNRIGLTNIITEEVLYRTYVTETDVKNLDIITCGPKPPNPAELLGSHRMKDLLDELKKDYDYVLIDTTPAIVVTDAALLASMCDGTVLVVSSGEAIIQGTLKAKENLQNVGANILGVVLNKVKIERSRSYYYYNYYNYYYNDSSKPKNWTKHKLFGKRRQKINV